MRIICAPDSFKDSLPATDVAAAMADGIRCVIPGAAIDLCPIADGGEGTLDAFQASLDGELHTLSVCGPQAERIDAAFGTFFGGELAVVEAAAAAGLQLVPMEARNPETSTSFGVGELIAAACATGPQRIIIGIGGSATNDGGCGMAQALGVRFFDRIDALIDRPICGDLLQSIGRIEPGRLPDGLRDAELVIASDVRNVLTGADGASAVYGPQKGATAEQVTRLDAGLAHLAKLIRRDLDLDVENLPGSGAAGGLGAGLVAFAGGRIASGIDTVLEVTDFARRVQGCDLCLTGEGKIDAQSLSGKACIGVARVAALQKVATVALVGARGEGADRCLDAGLDAIVVIGPGLEAAESRRRAKELIAKAAGEVALEFRG